MASARELFDRGQEAFNSHDVDGLIAMYADDAEFRGPGGLVLRDKAGIEQFTRGWFQGFPDCRIDASSVIESGDRIIEEAVFVGTHTGVFPTPMGDIPPTGRRVEGRFVDVFEFRDGRCVSDHLYFDRMELMEQLGLVPEPAGSAG
jgi:steroid delta-isomerase-like uncharacterized protein